MLVYGTAPMPCPDTTREARLATPVAVATNDHCRPAASIALAKVSYTNGFVARDQVMSGSVATRLSGTTSIRANGLDTGTTAAYPLEPTTVEAMHSSTGG